MQEEELHDGAELVASVIEVDALGGSAGRSGIVPHGTAHWPPALLSLLADVHKGFLSGAVPHLADSGEGSTYFLQNAEGQTVACFKPQDEEPFTPNNCKGWVGRAGQMGFRQGVLSGV